MSEDPRFNVCSIRRKHVPGRFARLHSHTRNTRQPARRNVRFTRASRRWFPVSFFCQNARLFFGCVACLGQPCQKQPSTKITVRDLRKTKSGRTRKVGRCCRAAPIIGPRGNAALPRISTCLRQPEIRCARNSRISASSVSRLPRPRMRDITSDRFALVKTSDIKRPLYAGSSPG